MNDNERAQECVLSEEEINDVYEENERCKSKHHQGRAIWNMRTVGDLIATIRDRDRTIAELQGLLRRCEWSAEVSGHWEEAGCPICGNNESLGHDAECELGKAITASM